MLNFTLALAGILPNSYPISCKCGYLFDNNENLTKTSCTHRLGCPTQSGYKILATLKILRINCGLGEVLCEDIAYNAENYNHHLDIFRLNNFEVFNCSSSAIPKVFLAQEALKRINEEGGISLATYISLYFFPNFGESYATRIFEDYDDLELFYKEVIDNQDCNPKHYIANKIGIAFYTNTVHNIYEYLYSNRDLLLKNLELFTIKKSHSSTIRICITGAVIRTLDDNGDYFKPREKFADYLSDKFSINVVLEKSATKSVEYVVCDAPSGSRKEKAAGNRLVTSDRLVEILKERSMNND